jgi:DNA repair photolyase
VASSAIRWRLAEDDQGPQGALFDVDELADRHVGTGEFRGMEFLHVNAGRIINEVPAASRLPFRYTINAYRGCSHACAYCLSGDTPILMGNGRTQRLAEVRVGDEIYGTERVGNYRRYVRTRVLDKWSTVKPGWRVRLEDGTDLLASGDHRFLTGRGWKHVVGAGSGPARRPHLTTNNELLGTGHFAANPKHDAEYQRGYLCGVIRGDGTLGNYEYALPRRNMRIASFRLALVDNEPLVRTAAYLAEHGVHVRARVFQRATGTHKEVRSIYTAKAGSVAEIRELIAWPAEPSSDWCIGFLAGIFDAEGSFGVCVRIANKDDEIIRWTSTCLDTLDFQFVVEPPRPENGVRNVRLRGGLVEVLRFLQTVDPAIVRKRDMSGRAIKTDARLRVLSVEPLGLEIPMFDITTGTGDFIADGVISHNCFARPTHEYLGLGTGEDFERKIVVKINAVERLRAELAARRWAGHHIAMGTNTDPYQRCEGKYHLTQGIVRVLSEARNPFSILTKSTLVLRDLELLTEASLRTDVSVNFSIGTLDEQVWRLTEPGTPAPARRVDAVRRLNEAGVGCGVLIAPILPGLSDRPEQLGQVVDACVQAGAVSITAIALHLRPGVREHYLGWLERDRPDLLADHEARYRRGAYLPKAEQEALTTTVRKLVADARGRYVFPARTRNHNDVGGTVAGPDAMPHSMPPAQQPTLWTGG